MSVDAIAAAGMAPQMELGAPAGLQAGMQVGTQAGAPAGAPAAGGFGALVAHGLGEVNAQLLNGQAALQRLATGDAQNLHQTMIQMEEVKLSFQLLMQVRGKALEAYQDVMKMQV